MGNPCLLLVSVTLYKGFQISSEFFSRPACVETSAAVVCNILQSAGQRAVFSCMLFAKRMTVVWKYHRPNQTSLRVNSAAPSHSRRFQRNFTLYCPKRICGQNLLNRNRFVLRQSPWRQKQPEHHKHCRPVRALRHRPGLQVHVRPRIRLLKSLLKAAIIWDGSCAFGGDRRSCWFPAPLVPACSS